MPIKFSRLLIRPIVIPVWAWLLAWWLLQTTWFEIPWLKIFATLYVFIIPGFYISVLLSGVRFNLLTHLTNGLALSMFIVSVAGVAGRAIGYSFDTIPVIFFVVGSAAQIFLMYREYLGKISYEEGKFSFFAVILLLVCLVFGTLVALWGRFHTDNLSYLGYVTSWQHSPKLSFEEVFFNSGNLDKPRNWFAMFPMNIAFLAKISGLHGILVLEYYIRPVLVVCALLAAYNLYVIMLKSRDKAALALLLQITFMFVLIGHNRHPGDAFFFRINEDKAFASFVMAPVFFLAVKNVLEFPKTSHLVLLALTGWSLALIHPVIMAFCVGIAAAQVVVDRFLHREFKQIFLIGVVLFLVLLPMASLRFIGNPWVSSHIFGISNDIKQPGVFTLDDALKTDSIGSRIAYIKGTQYYGVNIFNVKILFLEKKNLLSNLYIWVLAAGGVWAVLNLKKHHAAAFIFSTFLMISLSFIPYTGWIVGYFVTARLLFRVTWLFPLGLVSWILLNEAVSILSRKIIRMTEYPAMLFERFIVILISSVVLIYCSVNVHDKKWGQIGNLPVYYAKLSKIVNLGDAIETNIETPSTFMAEQGVMSNLPAISSKAKPLFFRSEKKSPYSPDMDLVKPVLGQDLSMEDRSHIFLEYNIDYLILNDEALAKAYDQGPGFEIVAQVDEYWIIKFIPSATE